VNAELLQQQRDKSFNSSVLSYLLFSFSFDFKMNKELCTHGAGFSLLILHVDELGTGLGAGGR
jgi:hypothetical protein